MNILPLTENGFDQVVNSETAVCKGVFGDIPAATAAVESEDWRRFFNNGSLGLLKICIETYFFVCSFHFEN